VLTKDSKAKEEGRGPGEPEVIYRRLGSSRDHVMVSRDKGQRYDHDITPLFKQALPPALSSPFQASCRVTYYQIFPSQVASIDGSRIAKVGAWKLINRGTFCSQLLC